jgi:hypothetical protein
LGNGGFGWTGRPALRCAAVAVTAVAANVLAWASPAAGETVVEIDAGYAGTYIPGRPLPVRVQLGADRLVSGDLQVSVNGLPTHVPVEVPGGSRKEFLIVVPTSTNQPPALTIVAQLPDGSKSPPRATTTANPLGDQEVVGLSAGALGGRSVPGPQPLAVDAGTARFVALSPADFDRAPDSLGALATMGLGGDELARMAPSTRNGVLAWVETGGRLLVDASPGGVVAGLPDAWQPGDDGRARAGRGEVRLTSGAMAAGRWSGLVEPSERTITNFRFMSGMPLGDSLARDAGFRLPELSWLVAFLVLYVAVVGPALYFVLRKRKRAELAWVVIPLVAVLFTGASWTGGRGLRNATQLVHGSVLSTGSTGSTTMSYVGVSSRSGGDVRIGWPNGWLTGGGAGDTGPVQTSPLSRVDATSSGPVGRIPLDANQFGLVSASGPSGLPGALEVTAVADGDSRAKGTVKNSTRFALEGAAVFMGWAAMEVGPLEPGQSREWQLFSPAGGMGGPPPEFNVLGGFRGPMDDSTRSFTRLSLWDVAQRAGLASREPGEVVAVAWTRDYEPPVRVGGRSAKAKGQTLVLGSAAVAAGGRPAIDVAVRREVVRTAGGGGSVFRFTFPEGVAVDPAQLLLRTPIGPAEVWTGDAWTTLGCTDCGPSTGGGGFAIPGPGFGPPTTVPCPPGATCGFAQPAVPGPVGPGGPFLRGSGEFPLPAEAVRDGVVYVRFVRGLPMATPGDTGLAIRTRP